MKMLIIGAAGRLGNRLLNRLSAEHAVTGADALSAEGLHTLDVQDFEAVRDLIHALKPEMVLHTAAWTDVDGCAREPDKALRINGYGAQNVAAAAADIGAGVLYVSTNEVFDGSAKRPYLEYDRPHPVNPYGMSKWVGEQGVMAVNPRHMIVRTAWLFAHGGRNFLQAIIGAAEAGKTLRVVTNEVANPTYTDDLAEAIAHLIPYQRWGTYHLVNAGVCSRYDFARYALDRAGYAQTPIERISTHQWPRPSTPPPYSGLNNLAAAMLGVRLRPWQEAVDAFLQREGLLKA